ncbi:MAG TPA: DUF4421 family protein [Bacteroidia bacterium]|nr:DUF4421 family protein [Bacteroidia bacterium]
MLKKILSILCLFLPGSSFAQFDTAFYIKYSDMLGVGVFQSIRDNAITFEKLNLPDSLFHTVSYNVNGKAITGFFLDYDKIYFAFGFKTVQNDNDMRKGTTDISSYVVQLGTNKLILEGGYRRYRGFYDESTPNYIAPFMDSTLYYQDKSLEDKVTKIKALYFLNHKKFSYNSSYFGSYRQLKSAMSWTFGGNFYYNKIKSDTSLIPYYARSVFNEYGYLDQVRVTGFSLGGGGSGNLVIGKRFFLNLTITLGLEPQWRRYHFLTGEATSPCYISFASDIRTSLGFNSRKFYFLISSINDLTYNNSKSLNISGAFLNGTISIGWRFHLENKGTKWLKENKLYKMI